MLWGRDARFVNKYDERRKRESERDREDGRVATEQDK